MSRRLSRLKSREVLIIWICLLACASSYADNDNKSRTNNDQMNNKLSFVDLLLRTNFGENRKSGTNEGSDQEQTRKLNICNKLSNSLNIYEIKICKKHQELIADLLPQIVELFQNECARISYNFRWSCSIVESFFDRSKFIGKYYVF